MELCTRPGSLRLTGRGLSMVGAARWQDSCSRPFSTLRSRGSPRTSAGASQRKKKVGAGVRASKKKRRKRSRVCQVDDKGNWWTLPRPKAVSHSCHPNPQSPVLALSAQPLPLILTTLQLSSQPQLPIFDNSELQHELECWRDRAGYWENKFQAAEAARLCALKEVQRLQQQVQEWAELLDQGQEREKELRTELEKFSAPAPDSSTAEELEEFKAEVQRLTSELVRCQQELAWEEARIASCELHLQHWRDWCSEMGLHIPFELR